MYKLALSVLLCACRLIPSIAIFGFQSGGFRSNIVPDSSNSYASALHYDRVEQAIYVVGSTYWSYWDRISHSDAEVASLTTLDAPDCFLAMLTMPAQGSTMNLAYSRRFGQASVEESCSALAFIPSPSDGETKIVTAGHTEHKGFMTTLRSLGSPVSTVYGFLLNLELNVRSKFLGVVDIIGKLDGGGLMNDHTVQYPVAVAVNPLPESEEDDAIYVASLSSPFKGKNLLGANLQQSPDKAAAGGLDQPEYGNHYSVFIKKLVSKTPEEMNFEDDEADLFNSDNSEGGLKETKRSTWTQLLSPSISLNNMATEHYLQISDLKYVPIVTDSVRSDRLVLVGTTSGYGDSFGGANSKEDDIDESFLYKTGFVTTFDVDGGLKQSTRIEIEEEDVFIKGVCYEEGKDHVEFIYLVGETRGLIADNIQKQDLARDASGRHSKHALLIKMNVQTLERVWARQVGGTLGKDVISHGCAVTPNDDTVYIAGSVADGDSIRLQTTPIMSAGGDDIFVANYDSLTGDINFLKQIGTSQNDWLAKGNGIVTDESGNAIILGNTRGSMMRYRGEEDLLPSSDIFVLSVEKGTGAMKTISEIIGEKEIIDIPSNDQLGGMDVMAVIIGAMIASVTSMYVGYRVIQSRNSDQRASTQTMSYLHDFKDPDYELHIRNSATGGVHAVYGKKKKMWQNETLIAQSPMTNSSVDSDIAEVMNETRYMSSKPNQFAPRVPPKKAFSGVSGNRRLDMGHMDSSLSIDESSNDDNDSDSEISFGGNELFF